MARGGYSRSPSPAGSISSRRSRRDDDRPPREKRDSKRRSRSPGDDRGIRDRDSRDSRRRGRRSPDRWESRRDDRAYYSNRRDRSRNRYRSPDRVNGYRQKSREREHRDKRNDSRERHRQRRHDSVEPKGRMRADETKDQASETKPTNKTLESAKTQSPAKPQSDEDKRAERLAKLEAWKRKQAAEKERKQKEQEAAGGTRNLLNELDRKAVQSSATTSPKSPATPTDSASPAPYAGKFDPKAIAKKATTNSAISTTLGEDVSLPKTAKPNGTSVTATITGMKRDHTGAATKNNISNGNLNQKALKARGNVTGFGLGGGKNQAEGEKPAKRALDFGEEESARKKLERLPTPPPDALQSETNAQVQEESDEDEEDRAMENAETEEEAAAAARLAAEKREERLLAESNEQSMQMNPEAVSGENEDVDMEDASRNGVEQVEEAEEELDPLDAFMSDLTNSSSAKMAPGLNPLNRKKSKQEPEAMFGDDDDEFSTMVANPDDILDMASKTRKKKDIPSVNHDKVEYESFRKAFYNEPTELAEMTEEAVADLRLELDGIKVRGIDVPKPVQKWSQFGLGVQMLDVVQKLGFEKPTAIQSQAVPAVMSGRDVIGIAKTGSGKTIAFLLPMFRHIKDQRPLDALDGPVGLIMTPTRELATQIHKECKPWLKALNLRAVCAYGGAPIKDQIADLKRGAEIIVCTPGRMIDLLAANTGRVTNLRRVTYIVLDEADRMFDMGFEPQVMKIIANIRPQRQTVLFSATFPRNMEALARKTLTKPVEIIVGGRSVVAPEIKQLVEVREENTKFIRLLQLLGELHEDEDARSLIFVDRQESAEDLMNAILRKGYPCFTIHGGKDQYDRDSVISDFKAGVFPVLVATSVAARGLDVKQLKMVVNFDCPNHLEDYVHRAGRTGRAGNTGLAVTFITENQSRFSVDIAKALKQSGQEVPEALQKLVESFTEKVKAGKEKASASGFGGKGLEKLDQERDAARNRERKIYKTGDEGEEEEKDAEDKTDEKKEEIVVKPAGSSATPLVGVPAGIDLDGHIKVHKTEAPVDSGDSKDLMKGVSEAAAAINARLTKAGQIRGNAPIDNKGPDAGAFHATLEINDFPQKARWAVTNRTNVAKILEATGTSITTKGNFYASGATPGANDPPKLYILVEGDTELVVTNAMRELMRLLKEGTTAAMDSEARAPVSGRYSVV